MDKPKRKNIPQRLKVEICLLQNGICACGCGEKLRGAIEYDHVPALALRHINGEDYDPPQLDPKYIFAKLKDHHAKKTFHPRGPHTTIDSDIHAIAKIKRLQNPRKPKKSLRSRGFDKRFSRKMNGTLVKR